jgi:hypothetical protein
LLVWQERADETLLLAPMRPAGEKQEAIYDYLRALQKVAEDNEVGRLLYVAATRAQTRLHLLARIAFSGEGAESMLKPPPKHSLLAKAWPVAESPLTEMLKQQITTVTAHSVTVSAEVEQTQLRLAMDWNLPSPPPSVLVQAIDLEHDSENEIEFSWVGETARQVGSVAHRWLQWIADDALEGWDATRIQGLHDVIARQLIARGIADADLPSMIRVGAGYWGRSAMCIASTA